MLLRQLGTHFHGRNLPKNVSLFLFYYSIFFVPFDQTNEVEQFYTHFYDLKVLFKHKPKKDWNKQKKNNK